MNKTYKTLAQWKRDMQPGRTVQCISFDGKEPREKIKGARDIVHVQSNALKFDGGSWLEFPSAKELVYYDDIFIKILNRA